MLKVEKVDVWGFEHAIRGMRNPMNSWDKSDSNCSSCHLQNKNSDCESCNVFIGQKDLELMQKLCKAGSEHRKFMRQIFVSMDITAPFYLWKELDTYKVGTVANSCSTMHKLTAKPFELSDFSCEHLFNIDNDYEDELTHLVNMLNWYRDKYLETKDKRFWWQIVQLLPMGYNQKRTITMNYENALTIIKQRTGHKLDEWSTLIEKLLELPYLKEIAEL